jgi:isopentenyl diphosphate isomerase/L-lactate dehydrogenase-like FMN-dependent dehydrogenase
VSIPQYGDYQFDIYFDGLEGQLPKYPVDFASLERKAAETLPSWVHSYVAGGCGDEGTQRANVNAFSRYAIVPRMLVGATERDLSVSLFDMTPPTQVFMAPIGVIGLCSQDFHGDIAVAKASAQTGVPMSAGTLTHALPAVVDAADGMPVLFDGGVRSGSDVAKALALGATAVGIGRPYAYALAVGGTDGVVAHLRAILAELDLLMAIDGFPTLADLRAAGAQRISP